MSYIEYHEQKQAQVRTALKIQDGEQTMTLEDLATKICADFEDCAEDCPGFQFCGPHKNGVLEWLRKVVNSEP